VACRYNLEVSGQRLASLVGRGNQQVRNAAGGRLSSGRSNEAILTESLGIERMRLLA